MLIKQNIFDLFNKLSENGWRELILSVTNNQLDIKQPSVLKLIEELLKPIIKINRDIAGFQDFSLEGKQGITPFSFSKSLIYHALASPAVISNNLTYFPTLIDLDLVENFLFSTTMNENSQARTLESLKIKHGNKLVIAVFAYQYRTWQGSSHRIHADMNFSRTGIARVGTVKETYDAKRRSFWVGDKEGEISVLPSRYGTFLAIEDSGVNISKEFSIMDKLNGDDTLKFLVPVHKLFDGDECLADIPSIKIVLETYQRNEKLKKVHDLSLPGTIKIEPKYKLNEFPFFIDDKTKPGFLYEKEQLNGSILIKPKPDFIVQPAIQNNEYVVFKVPKVANGNRFNTSFQIPANQDGRKSPEYVNMRHRVVNSKVNNPNSDIQSINNLSKNDFNNLINTGDYLAVDFVDKTADGFITPSIQLASFSGFKVFSSYSIITALDFFPLVNQRDIFRWDKSDSIQQFSQGGVNPLSNGRIKANINYAKFKSEGETITSVFSPKPATTSKTEKNRIDDSSLSYLPDGASDVFAPGWDISMNTENGIAFHASYGLGSPFPEDAKLCAALNSFWPAAAPDASRTFFVSQTFVSTINDGADSQFNNKKNTAIPLTDIELGIYPKQATLLGISSKMGWDGEFGPFLEKVANDEFVNYADIARSDYCFSAWKGLMHMDFLKHIKTSQLINRMKALQECISVLPPAVDKVTANDLWLVSFSEILDWKKETNIFDNKLKNNGFRFIFITTNQTTPNVDSTDIKRLKVKVARKFECQFDLDSIFWKETSSSASSVNLVSRNNQIPVMNLISHIL
jgi:hypothetical protein